MSPADLKSLLDIHTPSTAADHDDQWVDIDDFLQGGQPLDISHHGGEFEALHELRGQIYTK